MSHEWCLVALKTREDILYGFTAVVEILCGERVEWVGVVLVALFASSLYKVMYLPVMIFH